MENIFNLNGDYESLEAFLLPEKLRTFVYIRQLQLATTGSHNPKNFLRVLNKWRRENRYVTEGTLLQVSNENVSTASIGGNSDSYLSKHEGQYIVVKCEPNGGYINEDTEIYTVVRLPALERLDLLWNPECDVVFKRLVQCLLGPKESQKINKEDLKKKQFMYGPFRIPKWQFSDVNSTNKTLIPSVQQTQLGVIPLFLDHQEVLFRRMFDELSFKLTSRLRVFYPGQSILVGDFQLFTRKTRPCEKPALITSETDIYLGFDAVGEYGQVHVAPLVDTLPKSYEFDLLKDYLEPYFYKHRAKIFYNGDSFRFQGIQFRIIGGCISNQVDDSTWARVLELISSNSHVSYARVGPKTKIVVKEPVVPCLTDLLDPECIRHLRTLSPRSRSQFLIHYASQLDPESIARIGSDHAPNHKFDFDFHLVRIPTDVTHTTCFETDSFTCTVCCTEDEIVDQDNLFSYPCGHVFHKRCVEMWLSQNTSSCPNCRHLLSLSTLSNSDSEVSTVTQQEEYFEKLQITEESSDM